jgi:peptidoglycan/xylan/chitin deacetylase (PgdA/CDA1 family)
MKTTRMDVILAEPKPEEVHDCLWMIDVVKPLLNRFEVPATLIIVSGSRESEFCWDELTRILRPERDLPPRVLLDLDEGHSVPNATGKEARRRATVDLARRKLRLRPEQARRALNARWDLAGGQQDEEPKYRCMNDEELRQVTAGGLIEIGSHTITHPRLASHTEDEQRSEIEQSKAPFEAAAGVPIIRASYPNDSRDSKTWAPVQGAGYAFACGSDADVVLPTTTRWDLPRWWLPFGGGILLSRWLVRWVV